MQFKEDAVAQKDGIKSCFGDNRHVNFIITEGPVRRKTYTRRSTSIRNKCNCETYKVKIRVLQISVAITFYGRKIYVVN